VYGDAKAGEHVASSRDPKTGLAVHSLYGPTRKPTPEMLRGLDAVVYDLQDTGTRSYTFISTMGLAMEACAEAGVEFVVLDRPNPLGGVRVEGPMLDSRFRSFISQWNVPYVYGLTCGELAGMINGEGWIEKRCRLSVIPMKGWRRSMVWQDTGLRWTPTSPNIPTATAALGYPALGLFGELAGGTGLSIGAVVQRPFQCVVADWLDPRKLNRQLNSYGLRGLRFPTLSVERRGRKYRGVWVRFDDPLRAPLVALNFYMLEAVQKASGRNLVRAGALSRNSIRLFDKACGCDKIRKAVRSGQSAASIVASWRPGEEAFRRKRAKYLLYGAPASNAPPSKPSAGSFAVVTVVRGDTVYKIARDFGVSVSDIARANPAIHVDKIYVGQKLKVPRSGKR
jgi:uncharacterized protein YbbC (DUF1343 family)